MKWWKLILRAAWELLTLAAPKADDEDCGVDLGGQGRSSWRQERG